MTMVKKNSVRVRGITRNNLLTAQQRLRPVEILVKPVTSACVCSTPQQVKRRWLLKYLSTTFCN